MHIHLILDGVRSFRVPKKILESIEQATSRIPNVSKDAEVNVIITSAKKSQKLNAQYRQKTYVPDVLTFKYSNNKEIMGEIIVVPEIIKKQAKERKHSKEDEFTILVIHGIVHMLGYEHEGVSEVKKTAMKSLEKRLLRSLDLKLSDRSY